MGRTTRTILLRYGGAVIFTALAVLLRWLLDPWLGDSLPLSTLYGAVAVAVWLGGYQSALLAVVLGYLACDWLFTEPRGAFSFDGARGFIGLCLYLLPCGIIIGFGEAMHRARTKAETSDIEAHSYGEQLRQEITAHQTTEAALRAANEDAERRAQEAEAALRSLAESESRYRTISELIPYGVRMLDAEGRVTHLSACFLEMLGQTLEEHKKDWPSRIHPDDYGGSWTGCPAGCRARSRGRRSTASETSTASIARCSPVASLCVMRTVGCVAGWGLTSTSPSGNSPRRRSFGSTTSYNGGPMSCRRFWTSSPSA
jgi:PAS domain-containing protein